AHAAQVVRRLARDGDGSRPVRVDVRAIRRLLSRVSDRVPQSSRVLVRWQSSGRLRTAGPPTRARRSAIHLPEQRFAPSPGSLEAVLAQPPTDRPAQTHRVFHTAGPPAGVRYTRKPAADGSRRSCRTFVSETGSGQGRGAHQGSGWLVFVHHL